MQKLKAFQIHGFVVQNVIDELVERADELGIKNIKEDIVSISVLRPEGEHYICNVNKGQELATVEVVIVAWVDN